MNAMRIGCITLLAIVSMRVSQVWAETAAAFIHSTAEEGSPLNGNATFTDQAADEAGEGMLAVSIQISDAPAGKHGIHIHQFGDCGQEGQSAGGHYNPDGVPHGYLPKDGLAAAHAGDLGNIEIGEDGKGSLELTLPGVSVSEGPFTIAGRSVVLHQTVDDFGQPTGNAGGRIGCGTIIVTAD